MADMADMANIFVSYTSSDRDWAFWIGQQLEALGHAPHIHDWEISAGGDIALWMEDRLDKADNVLLVVSEVYLAKPYSRWERLAAEWAKERPNFALPVLIEDCKLPPLLAQIKRCELFGIDEDEEARKRLAEYLTQATKPTKPVAFPPKARAAKKSSTVGAVPFPGGKRAVSNIPIRVPLHFLGRDEAIAAINAALKPRAGRAAIAALVGLRGAGKSTLAAAYAEMRSADYRATWWVRAQTADGMRADLFALGVRLGWVAPDTKEAEAFETVRERLTDEGEGVLLVYDNAIDANSVRPYLPQSGAARVIVTTNAPGWRGIAEPVEIRLWPKAVGADYLIARTGRATERPEAESLSEALGGLPLAHEQAAAYCERLGTALADYRRRFAATPAPLLDATKDASPDYHGGLTVAKTFALAIEEAAKRHPAAEPLIVYAALLAPEPIPLFLFGEAREKFGEPFASDIAGDGLNEAVAALRAFALVDREDIADERLPSFMSIFIVADERSPSTTTAAISLQRLVRVAAAGRRQGDAGEAARRVLINAMAAVYPQADDNDPSFWPRVRRLRALAHDLVSDAAAPAGAEASASFLLGRLVGSPLDELRAFRLYTRGRSAPSTP